MITNSVISDAPSILPLMIRSLTFLNSINPPFSPLVSPHTSTTRTASSK